MRLLSPGVWDSTGVTLQGSKSIKLNFGLKCLGHQWFNGRNSINGLNPGGENVQPTKKVELFLKAPSVFSLVYQVGHLIPWFLTWMIQKNRLKTHNFFTETVVVSIFFFQPDCWGNDRIWFEHIFQMAWKHQLVCQIFTQDPFWVIQFMAFFHPQTLGWSPFQPFKRVTWTHSPSQKVTFSQNHLVLISQQYSKKTGSPVRGTVRGISGAGVSWTTFITFCSPKWW